MNKVIGKKFSLIIQVTVFVLCINSVCSAVVVEFTDESAFRTATGGDPQYLIDFETYGNGSDVVGQPTINGDEWLSDFGVQFDAAESGENLFLYDDPVSKGEYVSPIHALAPTGDRSSSIITFSMPVVSFGIYIVGNETGSLTERIILKDDSSTVLGDYDMPFGGGDSDAFFRGYLSNTPIAEIHIIENTDGEAMFLDNVMYTVPEPTTLLLLGLGGLILRKRRV